MVISILGGRVSRNNDGKYSMRECDEVRALLAMKTVAVVGLSSDPDVTSYEVARFLQREGFRIVPVNPHHAGQRILGELCHSTLTDAAVKLAEVGERIQWAHICRRAPGVPPEVVEAVLLGLRGVWLQLGILNDEAVKWARMGWLLAVQNRCPKIELMSM